MKLFLHTPSSNSDLEKIYKKAFKTAVELYVVTAFLTEWDASLNLNTNCKNFRVIIGKDFGITRKLACKKIIRWLSANRKSQFMVADEISGFHPKAMFWKTSDSRYYSVIGSSNLTKAAFDSNYEANIYSEISKEEFIKAKKWVKEIEKYSVVVSESWLENYQEGVNAPRKRNTRKKSSSTAIIKLALPRPYGAKKHVKLRQKQLNIHNQYKKPLHNLFRSCAAGKTKSSTFYENLPQLWSWEKGNRLQGNGWERKGYGSNFNQLAKSFIRIYDAPSLDRDDVVVEEIDRLKKLKIPTRTAFLSEMLCLAFPDDYPVLNQPVRDYLSDINFKAPRGASEGSKYVDLAKKLRFSLLQNRNHPAKNLAELDAVIWLEYHDENA